MRQRAEPTPGALLALERQARALHWGRRRRASEAHARFGLTAGPYVARLLAAAESPEGAAAEPEVAAALLAERDRRRAGRWAARREPTMLSPATAALAALLTAAAHHPHGPAWPRLVRAYFGRATAVAMCVVRAESGGDPRALNPSSGAAGLFQLMPQWYRGTWGLRPFDPFDAAANVLNAHRVFARAGHTWTPWRGDPCV